MNKQIFSDGRYNSYCKRVAYSVSLAKGFKSLAVNGTASSSKHALNPADMVCPSIGQDEDSLCPHNPEVRFRHGIKAIVIFGAFIATLDAGLPDTCLADRNPFRLPLSGPQLPGDLTSIKPIKSKAKVGLITFWFNYVSFDDCESPNSPPDTMSGCIYFDAFNGGSRVFNVAPNMFQVATDGGHVYKTVSQFPIALRPREFRSHRMYFYLPKKQYLRHPFLRSTTGHISVPLVTCPK